MTQDCLFILKNDALKAPWKTRGTWWLVGFSLECCGWTVLSGDCQWVFSLEFGQFPQRSVPVSYQGCKSEGQSRGAQWHRKAKTSPSFQHRGSQSTLLVSVGAPALDMLGGWSQISVSALLGCEPCICCWGGRLAKWSEKGTWGPNSFIHLHSHCQRVFGSSVSESPSNLLYLAIGVGNTFMWKDMLWG